jgi:ribosomal protein L11 methyltransferase
VSIGYLNHAKLPKFNPITPENCLVMEYFQKKHLAIRYAVREEDMDTFASALSELAISGLTEELDTVTVWFPLEEKSEQTVTENIVININELLEKYSVASKIISTEIIHEKNWNVEWEASIEPVWVNESLVITPSWKADTVIAPIKIIIDPQMSFGTGHHETTRMMAALLQDCVQPDSYWVDAGTGTGALAVVAVYCGARGVLAFDNDEWSVLNARENITRNGVASAIQVLQSDVLMIQLPVCDGIAANLHKNLLLASLARFYEALAPRKGILLVSGVLMYDEHEILQEAHKQGLRCIQAKRENEWCAIHLQV